MRKCEERKDKTLALNNLKQRRYIFQFSTKEELRVSNWTTGGTWARGGMSYWTDYQGTWAGVSLKQSEQQAHCMSAHA